MRVFSITLCLLVSLFIMGCGAKEKQAKITPTIHDAVKANDIAGVAEYLRKGVSVNKHQLDLIDGKAWQDYGTTPLHIAAENNLIEMAKFLIAHGADVNAQDVSGETPLAVAAAAGNINKALRAKSARMMEFLIARGANVNLGNIAHQTVLYNAVGLDNVQAVEVLLRNGAEVNGKEDTEKRVPLHEAALYGDIHIIKLLVEHDADINAQDIGGNTPLHLAISNGEINGTEILVKMGANIATVNKQGQTPLHMASFHNQIEIVAFLLKQHAIINTKDNKGQTPLDIAVSQGNQEIIKLLREYRGMK